MLYKAYSYGVRSLRKYDNTLKAHEYALQVVYYVFVCPKVSVENEIDFIVNTGRQKIYIQSALNVDTPEKKDQETCSLKNSGDFFRKIVVLDGNQKLWTDDDGISYVGVIPFLIDENIL